MDKLLQSNALLIGDGILAKTKNPFGLVLHVLSLRVKTLSVPLKLILKYLWLKSGNGYEL